VTALLNGEAQIITNIPPDQVKTLSEAPNVEVRDVPLANMHVLRYNTKHPVMKSEKLRQALNLGIDRKLLVDTLWNGRAVLTRGHQFDEYGQLYNANRPFLPFDVAKAKQLVAESGYKGETITYRTQGDYYTNGMAAGQAIIAMWKEIGVKAEIMLVTAGDKEDPATSMVVNWSNSSVLADPDGAFWRTWGKETSVQKTYWTPDPSFNTLGEEARTILDVKKRYENYQKMYDIWEREAPGTVLYIPVENYGVSKDVNWSPYPFYYMDLRAYNLSFNK
jgi:peptide/nickel transport system substrate-binding protein